jgi:DNA-binding transcriptional LysR family regulator
VLKGRSIQALEATLEVPLFDRLTNGVTPTKFGEAFLTKAQVLLQTREDMKRELLLMKGRDKTAVRVVATPEGRELSAWTG